MTTPASPLIRFLQFLGKVKFTTFLLLAGVVIMTVGTILESRGSREIAWDAVYGTAWFDLFLFLIGINLIIAVVNRIPIQRAQWPFVLTHFAIVLLLLGAWISRTYGYEGRLFIYEGSEENRLYLDGSEVQVRWTPSAGAEAVEATFPLSKRELQRNRTLQEEGANGPGIQIAEYIAQGVTRFELGAGGPQDPPGVEFTIISGDQQYRQWLIAGDPSFGRRDFRVVEVDSRQLDSSGDRRSLIGAGATLEVTPRGGSDAIQIPLPLKVGAEIPIGPGLVAQVDTYFENVLEVDGVLSEGAT
ncbi:MAG: hypothetical protein JRE43_12680, partial [Deltaproteobacteria bacterium]|nr:hypothetical protein [Deltaproteobacteria bacterium]